MFKVYLVLVALIVFIMLWMKYGPKLLSLEDTAWWYFIVIPGLIVAVIISAIKNRV